MRSLLIKGYGVRLSYRKGALVVKSKEASSTYSLADVDRVVLMTSGISVSTRAIRAMVDAGVELVVLDSRGFPAAVLSHPYVTRTVDARRGQYGAFSDGRGVEVVKVIAVSKILNQAGAVKRAARTYGLRWLTEDVEVLKKYADEVLRIEGHDLRSVRREVMEVEAAAARVYWGAYAALLPEGLGFGGRVQRGYDVVNKVLNYGYGILYPECWRSVALAGLDPYAGFLHTDRSGKPVLVFDVVEVFRSAAVDYPLLKLLRSGWRPGCEGGLLTHESRVEVARAVLAAMSSKFKVGGAVRELRSWITAFSSALASYLRGSSPIKPLVFRW